MSGGERVPLLVDVDGLPVPLPNHWALSVRRPRIQANTLIAETRALAHLYEWADRRSLDLESRCEVGAGLQPAELLALYQNLRYTRPVGRELANRRLVDSTEVQVVSASTHAARVAIVRDFLIWALERILFRLPVDDARQQSVRDRIEIISREAADFCRPASEAAPVPMGLSSDQLAKLLAVVNPTSSSNPFHKCNRFRNWTLVVLMLTFGFRRGEVLKIYVTDVNVRGRSPTLRIVRRPGDPNDPRAIEPAVKTHGREIPLGRPMAELLDIYIQHHRAKFPSAFNSPFLFLSDLGPLSLRMVNYIFDHIASRNTELRGFLTPHVMRYTYNDMLSECARANGVQGEAFKAAQNYLNGWNLTSDQGVKYSRRDIETNAMEISLAHQRSLFA